MSKFRKKHELKIMNFKWPLHRDLFLHSLLELPLGFVFSPFDFKMSLELFWFIFISIPYQKNYPNTIYIFLATFHFLASAIQIKVYIQLQSIKNSLVLGGWLISFFYFPSRKIIFRNITFITKWKTSWDFLFL